jgi:hypothetical protein
MRQGARAKLWLDSVSVAENFGFPVQDLTDLVRVVDDSRVLIERAWHEHFGD